MKCSKICKANANHRRRVKILNTSDGTIPNNIKGISNEVLRELLNAQNNKCMLCNIELNLNYRHLDHIIPISKGGEHSINNVQWLCPPCNLSKSDKIFKTYSLH